MNKLKICCLCAAALIFLAACGQTESDSSITTDSSPAPSDTEPSQPPGTDPPVTIVVEDDSQPPQDGMVRSRLTNEWVDAGIAATRPLAVIIPNEIGAVPHYSLSKASILYEANVEGRMSRLMAIYEDWMDLEKIGNIRSLRTYYAYWAFEWDAFLVHYGGPFYVDALMAEPNTQHVDGMLGTDSAAFFRSTDRPQPHNAYATGSDLSKVIARKGYSLSYRGLTDSRHFLFAPKSSPNALTQYREDAKNATYIDMSGCYPLTRCYFEFNEEDGLYYRSQHLLGKDDGPHIDADTGKQLSFKNILVQYVKYEVLDPNDYLAFQCQDTTMDGWFFTNGKGVHVTWTKTGDYSSTRFYDDFGNEITLNTGKTMICVVEEGDNFTFR